MTLQEENEWSGRGFKSVDVDQDEPVDLEVMLREQSFDDDQFRKL
jgi:capsule polysaccharide export protein KpsC/LpsZ